MDVPEPPKKIGLLAGARAALAPAFRPQWWEFAITFGLVAVAYPFVTRIFWLGRGLGFATVSGYVVVWGLPAAIVALSILWKSEDPRAKAAARALLQLAIVIVTLVPLNIAGAAAHNTSLEQTMRNAAAIVQEVTSFRERNGRWPESLDEVERSSGRELPAPTYAGDFVYEAVDGGFVLGLRLRGQPEVPLYDSRRAEAAAGAGQSPGPAGAAPPDGRAGPDGAAD